MNEMQDTVNKLRDKFPESFKNFAYVRIDNNPQGIINAYHVEVRYLNDKVYSFPANDIHDVAHGLKNAADLYGKDGRLREVEVPVHEFPYDELDKKLNNILNEIGEKYPADSSDIRYALQEVKQAFEDAGYKRCTEAGGMHAHRLEDDGESHNVRPGLIALNACVSKNEYRDIHGREYTHFTISYPDGSGEFAKVPRFDLPTQSEWEAKAIKDGWVRLPDSFVGPDLVVPRITYTKDQLKTISDEWSKPRMTGQEWYDKFRQDAPTWAERDETAKSFENIYLEAARRVSGVAS